MNAWILRDECVEVISPNISGPLKILIYIYIKYIL